MTIPTDIIVCLVTLIGSGLLGLLTIIVHQGVRISATLASIEKRNAVEDERNSNLVKNVTDIQARLDRQGVLA